MATVRKHRGRWCADFRDQHGFRRIEVPTGTFENAAQEKLAAQTLLTKRLAEVSRGQHQPLGQRPTFSEVCTRFLESKVNLRPSTLRSYRGLIQCYLDPYFGRWKVQSISPTDVERFRFELTQGLPIPVAQALIDRRLLANPKWSRARAKQDAARTKVGVRTVNKALTLLVMVFNYASKHRWVDYNAAEQIERLSDPRSPDEQSIDGNILAPGEIKRLLDAMPDGVYRMIVQTAAFTGARQSELIALQWGDVDWNSRQVHVRRAWREGRITLPKTRNSTRRIDLPEFLVNELKAWKLRCPKSELDLVFPNEVGRPLSHSNLLSRGFYPALRRAGLRRVRFHDLRHSYASMMLASGADVVRVSRLLGHASPTVTLSVYAHQLPTQHYASVDGLAKLVYGQREPQAPASSTESVIVPFPAAAVDRKS
jgi:integrase